MDTCTVETGLLRKKPCGQTATQKCLNCEQPLCASHAVAQTAAGGRKTGKYLCKECHAAWRDIGETEPAQPVIKKPVAPAKDAPAAGAPKAPAAAKPAEAKPAEAKPAEAPAEKKPADSGSGGLDFK